MQNIVPCLTHYLSFHNKANSLQSAIYPLMLNIVKLFIANWGLENVWKKNCYFCLCSLFLSSSLPFPIRVRHILAAIN
ncbi:unknown [Prevotella sp. CAG:485]|nr:unknown [Prevotella sp. CAG:485]